MLRVIRFAVLVVWATIPVSACSAGAGRQVEGTVGSDLDDLELRYTAWGGMQRVDARFSLDADGRGRLYVGTSASVPQAGSLTTVGFFAGQVDAATRGDLTKALRKGKLLDGSRPVQPAAPDSVVRTLTLVAGGREVTHTMAQPDRFLGAAEKAVLDAMVALLDHPLRAVRAELGARRAEGGIRAEVRLANVGSEPVRILLYDPDDPDLAVRAGVTFFDETGAMHGDVGTPPEHLAKLAAAGELATGPHDLEPGQSVVLALPEVPAPGSPAGLQLAGGMEFWLLDGDDRRPVSLGLAAVPVPR